MADKEQTEQTTGIVDMRNTGISWTDSAWNPIRGCSRVSEGCRHCYAERVAVRFSGPGQPYEGLAQVTAPRDLLDPVGGRRNGWTGAVRFVYEHLADPLRWRKPRLIFVNSMSDLFHEKLTNEQIAAVFGVMAAAPQHTFKVLTKRAKRMREWFEVPGIAGTVERFRCFALAGRIEEYFAPERVADLSEWPGYAITSKGRIISNKRGDEHEMKVMRSEQGHGHVMLYREGAVGRPLVHRLVLEAFDRVARDGDQGCHIDGDPTNNALWNLRWGTQSDNWGDSKRHGSRLRYSKLSTEQLAEIRRISADEVSGAEIGRRFNISDTQARNIVSGKQWTPEREPEWPLRSVWLGVSVENQSAGDERIPELLRTPAAVRFISAEPLIGPLNLTSWIGDGGEAGRGQSGPRETQEGAATPSQGSGLATGNVAEPQFVPGMRTRGEPPSSLLSWVIAGCESGPDGRRCDVEWLRSLRDQCAIAAVPFFLKQAKYIDGRRGTRSAIDTTPPFADLTKDHGSKRKAGGVIELPYLDGVQHVDMPESAVEK